MFSIGAGYSLFNIQMKRQFWKKWVGQISLLTTGLQIKIQLNCFHPKVFMGMQQTQLVVSNCQDLSKIIFFPESKEEKNTM